MLCAPRPIVGGAECGGWLSLNPCGGGSTRRPRQALQCRSQRRPSGLRGPCVCVTVFACVSGSTTGQEGVCGLFGWFGAFPVYCSPLDPTLPSASLGPRAVDGRTCVRREVYEVNLGAIMSWVWVGYCWERGIPVWGSIYSFVQKVFSECRCTICMQSALGRCWLSFYSAWMMQC